MKKISFEDYVSDVLDLQVGLMSEKQIAEARTGYNKLFAPKPVVAKHRLSNVKVAELRKMIEHFVSSQKIAIERNSDKDLTIVKTFIAEAEKALAGRAEKAELLKLIDLNSEASRSLAAQ